MTNLFLDTGYIVALELHKDQWHEKAIKHWQELVQTPFHLTTTSYVFDEAMTCLNSKGRHDKALIVGKNLLQSAFIDFIHVDENLFNYGWQLFKNRKDMGYSLTDCISFVVMRNHSLNQALAFDKHFEQEGFLLPAKI